MDKNMDMNTKKQNKFTLYVKEQLVIGTMVLCFALSGICLPFIKERTLSEPLDSATESSHSSNGTEEDKNKNSQDKSEETPSEKQDGTETNTFETPQNTTVQDGATNPNTSAPSNSTDTADGNSSSTTPSETPNKIWVPPVYETIHHEAVYETKTFYYCSGAIDESGVVCNQKFDSLQGWSTHKSIHGG